MSLTSHADAPAPPYDLEQDPEPRRIRRPRVEVCYRCEHRNGTHADGCKAEEEDGR